MSLQERHLETLSRLIPAGAAAMSLLLGSATPSEANLTDAQPSASASIRVSEHLRAIREAVSAVDIQVADVRPVPRWHNSVQHWTKWGNVGWSKWAPPPPN
jgi:hypothetical protein